MNYWAKLGLSLVGLGIVVGIWFGDEYYTKKETEEKKIAEKVLNFESEKVRSVTLKTSVDEFSFLRDSATSEWKFGGQFTEIHPDQDAVNNFVAALKDMRRERELEGYDESKKKDFGLEKPRRFVELGLEGGAKLAFEIGGDVQIGKSQGSEFKALSVYAHLVNDNTQKQKSLLVIPSSALTQTDKKFADFRTKSVVKFTRENVASFSYTGKEGSVKVAKKDGNWTVTLMPAAQSAAEKVYAGDSNGIGLYIDKVQRLRADAVVEKSALGGGEKLSEYGLANPARVVSFYNEAGEILQELKIGVTETRTNLTMADGAVAQLAVDQYAELAPELKTFRDLKVMSGVDFSKVAKLVTSNGKSFQKEGQKWYPVKGEAAASAGPEGSQKAAESARSEQESRSEVATLASDFEFMRAKDIIDPENVKADAAYGFDQPVESFSFEFSSDSAINKIGIKVGRRVETDEKSIYMKRDGSAAVYIIETTWMDSLKALEQEKSAPKAEAAPTKNDSEVSPQAKKEN